MSQVSIVIPVGTAVDDFRNMSEWLLDFNDERFEIIFVIDTDDIRTLHSFYECLDKCKRRKYFKILNCDKRNPGSSRNIGIHHALSNWVSFWDSDDSPILPAFISMIEEAEVADYDLVLGQYIHRTNIAGLREHIHRHINNPQKDKENLLLDPGLWRYAFRRKCIGNILFEPWRMAEDQTFLGEVLRQELRIGQYHSPVYTYDQTHSNQLTNNTFAIQDIQKALRANMIRYFQNERDFEINSMLVSKQTLTSLKLLKKFAKIDTIFQLAKLIVKANWIQRKTIYSSMLKLMRTRESQYEKI